jgi:hypothetical protein
MPRSVGNSFLRQTVTLYIETYMDSLRSDFTKLTYFILCKDCPSHGAVMTTYADASAGGFVPATAPCVSMNDVEISTATSAAFHLFVECIRFLRSLYIYHAIYVSCTHACYQCMALVSRMCHSLLLIIVAAQTQLVTTATVDNVSGQTCACAMTRPASRLVWADSAGLEVGRCTC